MGVLPQAIEELLDTCLAAELTVVNERGEPVTYPLIPLYNGEKILMHSSVLFSKKLEHIKSNPRVSVSLSDPKATPGLEPFRRATIQGEARVVEDDLHTGWEPLVLDRWVEKEPVIRDLLKQRVAMPLFWERSVIEITPRRAYLWPEGDTAQPPQVFDVQPAASR